MDDLLAVAAAALGAGLSEPTNLGGSERSAVLRCRADHGGSVVVKSYPRTRQGADSFTAEAAGLAFAGQTGAGPRLLAASQDALLVVMTDLGTAPSLADLLLSGPREAAETALLGWARACARLAAGAVGRELELADLLARYRTSPDAGGQGHWLERRIGEIPALLGELSIWEPDGLRDDLADVATILRSGGYEVFSPGDICPDNNLLTGAAVRFVDFECAEYHSAFLDAAYLRMPFSTCWCVFRLPGELVRSAEAAYRDLVCGIFPDLASDEVWQPGIMRATAAWTLHAMTYLLDRALVADRPMTDDGRAAPTARQLLRYRWQQLVAELEPAGELTALSELMTGLLAATEHWRVPDLPLYPAFR